MIAHASPAGRSRAVSRVLPERARRALQLPAATRLSASAGFFRSYPQGPRPFGLGRGVVDFVAWELRTGRLATDAGSEWWRIVNGVMMLDLREAGRALREATAAGGSAAAWVAFARAEREQAQARLWEAHRASLDVGLALAAPLLAFEPHAERAFADVVVAVVSHATRTCAPTTGPQLAELTARHYPACYPATEVDVERLHTALAGLLGST